MEPQSSDCFAMRAYAPRGQQGATGLIERLKPGLEDQPARPCTADNSGPRPSPTRMPITLKARSFCRTPFGQFSRSGECGHHSVATESVFSDLLRNPPNATAQRPVTSSRPYCLAVFVRLVFAHQAQPRNGPSSDRNHIRICGEVSNRGKAEAIISAHCGATP